MKKKLTDQTKDEKKINKMNEFENEAKVNVPLLVYN